ncbi:MAG: hypothetical protein ACW99G_15180, partial [Candidatus Thorarchaeota archaeon]
TKLIDKHGTPRTEGEAQKFGVVASEFVIKRHGQLLQMKAEIEADPEISDEQRKKELKDWERYAKSGELFNPDTDKYERKIEGLGYIPKGELRLSARSRIEE